MPVAKINQLSDYVGKEVGVSDWLEITQERVNAFADVTEDHQFIHIDEDKAAQTPFGGTIAHGFLTLSLIPKFAQHNGTLMPENIAMSINYGLDKIRFLSPVKVGASIRARFRFLGYEEKRPGQLLFRHEVVIEIKDEDTPAMIAHPLVVHVLA